MRPIAVDRKPGVDDVGYSNAGYQLDWEWTVNFWPFTTFAASQRPTVGEETTSTLELLLLQLRCT